MSLVSQFNNTTLIYGNTPDVETDLYTCQAGQKVLVIGFDICNVVNSGVSVDVLLYPAATPLVPVNWLSGAPVPVGSTLPVIQKQKLVLTPGDVLKVKCNIANGIHIILSTMEVSLVES